MCSVLVRRVYVVRLGGVNFEIYRECDVMRMRSSFIIISLMKQGGFAIFYSKKYTFYFMNVIRNPGAQPHFLFSFCLHWQVFLTSWVMEQNINTKEKRRKCIKEHIFSSVS